MYKRLEALGTSLLRRFVPNVDASAVSPASCGWRSYGSCWQCGYSPCQAYCCTGEGCGTVVCE